MDSEAPNTPQARGRTWIVRYPLGRTDAARSMGTVAAPLLAGFALATIVVLATADPRPRLGEPALLALTAAAGLFVFSLQFTATGLMYSATPGERSDWIPDAASDPRVMGRVQRVQHKDLVLQGRYFFRARLCYDAGILAYLLGLLFVLVPHEWTPERVGALVLISAAIVLEIGWMSGTSLGRRWSWLTPGYEDVRNVE